MKKMKKTKIFITLFFSFYSLMVGAVEKFYFGPHPRDLEINSKEETLFIFPSPPIAQVCHPSNIVQMLPVESFSEMQFVGLSNQIIDFF